MHFIINFGVAASRKKISLETLGKNIKDFRIPDERGN
jgi:pyrrolidone-carboxylate peptidase